MVGILGAVMAFAIVFISMPALLPILGNGTYALLFFAVSHFGFALTTFIESFDKEEKVV